MISVQTVVRFLLAGGGNTLLTAGVTSTLSLMVPTAAAYSIGYAAGLALSVVTASRFVFRRRLTTERAGQLCAVNLLAFLCGLVALNIAQRFGLAHGLAGLSVLVTAPVSFLGGVVVFRGGEGVLNASEDALSPDCP